MKNGASTQGNGKSFPELWQKLAGKFEHIAQRIGVGFPFLSQEGMYPNMMERMPGDSGQFLWTNGFWPGMLWQMYGATSNETYKALAVELGQKIAQTLTHTDKLTHDVGFVFMLSAVAEYKATGSDAAKLRALKAADVLAGRFNPQGNFIRAWNESRLSGNVEGWMIVDCMMNLQLLFWASRETGDSRYAAIAKRHADTALAYLLRTDGSSNHIIEFSQEDGSFVCAHGGQGYAADSAWSRGQGWAVYGFALCYRNTGEDRYLEAAKKCAHYCIANLAVNDWVPLVDFKAPPQPVKVDTAAGAILACGFDELARHVGDNERAVYQKAAEKALLACAEGFGNLDVDKDVILEGGALEYHDEKFANAPAIYGDYFFIEALLRLTGKEMGIW